VYAVNNLNNRKANLTRSLHCNQLLKKSEGLSGCAAGSLACEGAAISLT